MATTTRSWTKDEILEKLATDDKWLVRGMLAIWNYQTNDEQSIQATRYHNSVGFNGADAPILSSLCEWYTAKRFLTPKQLGLARRKMAKYAGQLARIANGEQ